MLLTGMMYSYYNKKQCELSVTLTPSADYSSGCPRGGKGCSGSGPEDRYLQVFPEAGRLYPEDEILQRLSVNRLGLADH